MAEDSPGRAYAHDPLWGLASLPARWAPQWAVHTHQTGDSDDDPLFGYLRDEDIPEFGGSSTAGTTTWLVWGPGPGWCTALAAKERRTQSPSAGGA